MLEDAINNHAAAIRELVAAMLATAGGNVAKAPAPETKPATAKELIKQAVVDGEKAQAEKKALAEAAASVKATEERLAKEKAANEKAAEELAGGSEAAPVLDYSKDVEHKFKAFLKEKGREAGLALLKKYGAASGSQVAQGKLAAFLADIEAA